MAQQKNAEENNSCPSWCSPAADSNPLGLYSCSRNIKRKSLLKHQRHQMGHCLLQVKKKCILCFKIFYSSTLPKTVNVLKIHITECSFIFIITKGGVCLLQYDHKLKINLFQSRQYMKVIRLSSFQSCKPSSTGYQALTVLGTKQLVQTSESDKRSN